MRGVVVGGEGGGAGPAARLLSNVWWALRCRPGWGGGGGRVLDITLGSVKCIVKPETCST